MKIIPLLSLLVIAACNTNTAENYSKFPSERIKQINTPIDRTCVDPVPVPGTDQQVGTGVGVGVGVSKPTCEVYCPSNFEVLPKPEPALGYLSFEIPAYMYKGRCRGHAIVTQQFNMLANFDKAENKHKCGPDNLSSTCMKIYEKAIKDITENNKVADIPGFKNLASFSSFHPFRGMLRNKVISYEPRFGAGYGSVDNQQGSLHENVFNEVYLRVKNRQMPYVGIYGGGIGHHAIVMSGIREVDGERRICVSDPNKRSYIPPELDMCQNYVRIKGGSAVYVANNRAHHLSRFNILSDEDHRLDAYVKARRKECIEDGLEQKLCVKSVEQLISKQ